MKRPEDLFAEKVDKYLKTLKKTGDLWYLNVVGSPIQRSGIADRLICYKGRFIAIELKREDGKGAESKNQEIERQLITKAGGIAIVADNLDDIKSVFERL